MAALNINKVLVGKKKLHCPPMIEVADVLKTGLSKNFSIVETAVVDCPDLTKEPFTLAASGLGGSPVMVDVGGPSFIFPLVHRDKIYDLLDIYNLVDVNPALIIGAGAGPWPYVGVNCEGIYNLYIENGRVTNQSHTVKVNPTTGSFIDATLPNDQTKFALLGNLFCSKGIPGKVIKVHCKVRTGDKNFISAIRECLADHYKEDAVGLGGTFLLRAGKAKQHVMPDFPETTITTDDGVNEWLKFYEMSAPLVAVGTLISDDPGLDLRVQHFHSFSHHGEGGHYHYDTTPDTVEYIGYFNIAEQVYRVDQPLSTLIIGRD